MSREFPFFPLPSLSFRKGHFRLTPLPSFVPFFSFISVDDEIMEPIPTSPSALPPPTSPLEPFLHLPTLLKFEWPSSPSSPPAEPLPATPSDLPFSSPANKVSSETPTTPTTNDFLLGVSPFSPPTPSFDFSSSCSNSSYSSSVGSIDHLACDDDQEEEEEDAEGSSSRSLAELLQGSIFPTPPSFTPKDRASKRILDFQQPFDVEMMGDDEVAAGRTSWGMRRTGTL